MNTFHLPILPMIAGLVLLIAGYHFNDALDLKIAGALFMAWGTITHFKNIRLARQTFNNRTYVKDYFL